VAGGAKVEHLGPYHYFPNFSLTFPHFLSTTFHQKVVGKNISVAGGAKTRFGYEVLLVKSWSTIAVFCFTNLRRDSSQRPPGVVREWILSLSRLVAHYTEYLKDMARG